jgi:CHAT domain-containing protein/Tfp pilus assembly protein PilF
MPRAKSRLLWLVVALCLSPFGYTQDTARRASTPPAGGNISTVEELATALAAAGSESECGALLAAKKELVTAELGKKLVKQGNDLVWRANYPEALRLYQLALGVAEQINDQAGIADALEGVGIVHYRRGDLSRAMECHRKSLALREATKDEAGIGSSLNQIGYVHFLQGDYGLAMQYYQNSLKLREKVGNQAGNKARIAATLVNIGIVHYRQGNLAVAMEYMKKSLKLREELGNKARIAASLKQVGHVHFLQGDYGLAVEHYRRGLKLSEEEGNKTETAFALQDIGAAHTRQGDYDSARESYQKSLKLHEESGDRAGIASSLLRIGYTYQEQGDLGPAMGYYRRGLKLNEELENKAGIADGLEGVGIMHYRQGDLSRAMDCHQRSLTLREALRDKAGVAGSMNQIGYVHFLQGDYDIAAEYYQKSLKLWEELGRKADAAVVHQSLGILHARWGHYALALEYHRRALAQYEILGHKAGIANTLLPIGSVHLRQGDYRLASEYYQKALTQFEASGNKWGVAVALSNFGYLHEARGDHAKALEVAGRAAAIAREIGGGEPLISSQTAAAMAYRALNYPAQARQALEEAIATVESLRAQVAGGEQEQQRFFEDKVSPYHAMVELLVAQNEPGEALNYAERAKARVLLDVLQSGKGDITKAMTAQEKERERKLRTEQISLNSQVSRESLRAQPDQTRLADLKARLQKARLEYEAFQTSLYAGHPELKAQRGEAKTVTPEETAGLLPDAQSALLEYVVTDEKTYLFVLSKDNGYKQGAVNLKSYTLPIKRKELADHAAAFRQQLARRDLTFRPAASKLYDLLLKPARAELQGKQTLVIVPDGALWELPFQALLDAQGRYLIEDHALSYAPSLTVLREMAKLRRRKADDRETSTTLLAMGNPALGKETVERVKLVHRDEELAPLPEAEKEVKTLAGLYGARSQVYVGAEAREDRVKAEAGRFRVLHLATHSILNNASPMYSQVVLARAGENASEDGLLEAWEIMKLELRADLVVLSACETGRGKVGAGEGMIGLTWALFVAGSPTAVVSQWKVESASTTRLMLELHRNLQPNFKKSQLSTAKALQRAAVKMLGSEDYRHPFYWAGFVVVGEGG